MERRLMRDTQQKMAKSSLDQDFMIDVIFPLDLKNNLVSLEKVSNNFQINRLGNILEWPHLDPPIVSRFIHIPPHQIPKFSVFIEHMKGNLKLSEWQQEQVMNYTD